jgi:hypothetical protein
VRPSSQIVYRADAARHFKAVSFLRYACAAAKLVHVDPSRGIRSIVARWDDVVVTECVVAPNSGRYRVLPLISPNYESGRRQVFDDRVRYSEDFSKRWRTALPCLTSVDSPVTFVGSTFSTPDTERARANSTKSTRPARSSSKWKTT